jgi:hypothetical protein
MTANVVHGRVTSALLGLPEDLLNPWDRALAGRLLLCQVGLRKGSRAALAGRAGLPGWGCFIPSTSRWATTPWPGRKLGDDGGGLVTGLQPGHGAVGRCQVNGMKRKQPARVQAASATVPLDLTVRSKP